LRTKQKLRGLHRRKSEIDKWIKSSLDLDLGTLINRQVYYKKIWVYPWSNLFCDKQPPTDYRNQITSGLIDIFINWQTELEKLNQPYYLKIWLNYPRFKNSQVVVAIGDKIDYYNNIFLPTDKSISFPHDKFASNKERISKLSWQPFLDEETYCESDFDSSKEEYENEGNYHYDQRLIKRFRENHDRKEITTDDICYFKTRGLVWCGESSTNE
jgi:hypothetical protein